MAKAKLQFNMILDQESKGHPKTKGGRVTKYEERETTKHPIKK